MRASNVGAVTVPKWLGAHSHHQLIHALLTHAPQRKCCCRIRLANPGPPLPPAPPSAARPAAKRGDPAPAAAAAPRLRHGRVGKQAAGGGAVADMMRAVSSPGKRFQGQQISMHVCTPPPGKRWATPAVPEQFAACAACCSAVRVRLVLPSDPQVTFVSEMGWPGPGSRSAAGPEPCLRMGVAGWRHALKGILAQSHCWLQTAARLQSSWLAILRHSCAPMHPSAHCIAATATAHQWQAGHSKLVMLPLLMAASSIWIAASTSSGAAAGLVHRQAL